MRFTQLLLSAIIIFITNITAKSQELSCPDFTIIAAYPDSINPNTYQFSIQSAGAAFDQTNYPQVSAVLDCNGDTVASSGGLSWFGQLGQTTQDYPATLSGNGSINCYPLNVFFVINSNQGISDTCQLIYSATSIVNSSINTEELSVFPNPASEEIHLSVDEKFIGSAYSIFDYLGRIVQTGTIHSKNNPIDLKNLSAGAYILKLGKASVKIIIK
jgi:hypothetical protein